MTREILRLLPYRRLPWHKKSPEPPPGSVATRWQHNYAIYLRKTSSVWLFETSSKQFADWLLATSTIFLNWNRHTLTPKRTWSSGCGNTTQPSLYLSMQNSPRLKELIRYWLLFTGLHRQHLKWRRSSKFVVICHPWQLPPSVSALLLPCCRWHSTAAQAGRGHKYHFLR